MIKICEALAGQFLQHEHYYECYCHCWLLAGIRNIIFLCFDLLLSVACYFLFIYSVIYDALAITIIYHYYVFIPSFCLFSIFVLCCLGLCKVALQFYSPRIISYCKYSHFSCGLLKSLKNHIK